jgi:peroxisomal trans-2-enoyl-CoA reductase
MVESSQFRPGLLRGRVALVTGGGSGLGKVLARELLSLGCDAVIASRNVATLERAAAELRADLAVVAGGGRVDLVKLDIRDEAAAAAAVAFTLERFGRLDFLANVAGGQFPAPASAITARGWRAVVDLNLNGTFIMCRAAYDGWFSEHGGSIVNVVATYHQGFPLMAHTGASRAGVANLTETLAVEWASSGVRINAVAPGIMYTTSAVEHYLKSEALVGPGLLESQVARIPAKRMGSAEEIASAITYLFTPAASYITGSILKVDGAYKLLGQGSYALSEVHTNYPSYGTTGPGESKL